MRFSLGLSYCHDINSIKNLNPVLKALEGATRVNYTSATDYQIAGRWDDMISVTHLK